MARYVDVSISGFTVQVELQTKQVHFYDPGNWMTSPQWWAQGVRAISPQMRVAFPGFQARGAYKETPGISIELFNPDGTRFAYLGLSGGMGGGTAYGPSRRANQLPDTGRWYPSNKPIPHTWFGLMFKGGGGLGLGAEGQAAALLSAMDRTHGCTIGALSGRLGPVGGGSAGLAVVFATGFTTPTDFSNYTANGLDWALSFGAKFSAFVKGAGKLSVLAAGAAAMLERLEGAARIKALEQTMLKPEIGAEVYGIGKSLISGSLIDTDLQSITVVDIPMVGVGAEIGIYYAKTGYKCLSEW
jgi:hypothetical protein